MKLIAILLSLLIEHFSGGLHEWRKTDWISAFNNWLYQRFEGHDFRDGPVGVLMVVGSLALATWLVWAVLANVGWFLGFLFGLVVLLYCIGPRDLTHEVEQYIDAVRRGDNEAAFEYAVDLMGDKEPQDLHEAATKLKGHIFVALNERLLSVLFWFLVLGPIGAVIYRVAIIIRADAGSLGAGYVRANNELIRILDWPGTRISVVALALAGNFVDTMVKVKSVDHFIRSDNAELMIAAATGAMQRETDVEEGNVDLQAVSAALALAKRSFLVWLAVIAVFTIAGWVV